MKLSKVSNTNDSNKISSLNNKKITIFGTTFTIKIVDKLGEDNEIYGKCSNAARTIEIARIVDGQELPLSEIYITLLHELIHSILDTGAYCTVSQDEPLVEWLARNLYSLIEQKVLCLNL